MTEEDYIFIAKAISGKLSQDEESSFNLKMQNDSFRQAYLHFILDERLISKTLELENVENYPIESSIKSEKPAPIAFFIGLAASIAIAFSIFFNTTGIAIIESGEQAYVIRNNEKVKISQGFKLQAGDRLITTDEKLSFSYKDGTVVELDESSEALVFLSEAGGKMIKLQEGDLTADVTPQFKGQEMQIYTKESKALVLGTKFTISSAPIKSNLQVHKGKVQFFNTTGSKDFVIGGEYANARSDAPVISQESFISDERKKRENIKYNRWKTYSQKFINDPDTVAYYDFEDVSLKQVDVLYNKAEATKDLPLNGEIITTLPLSGRWHQKGSLYFSEYGYVNFQRHEVYNIPGPITVFAWMKVKKFDRGWQTIISKGDRTWRLARNQWHNYMEFCCSGLDPHGILIGKKNVNDGNWHLLVGTYDGKKMKLYVDGELDMAMEATGLINQDDYPVNIGANAQKKERDFEGWIDELGILKRALSASEVQEMWEIGKPN